MKDLIILVLGVALFLVLVLYGASEVSTERQQGCEKKFGKGWEYRSGEYDLCVNQKGEGRYL